MRTPTQGFGQLLSTATPMLDTPWVRANLDKAPDDVASMFDGVAERYDVANEVLALGQTRVWRRALVNAVAPMRGEVILDLAAGTGSSSEPLAGRGATVIPCDFSTGMLLVGHDRRPGLPFTAGDALHLPFGDAVFDAATISFGLRNVEDPSAALTEFARVVRPGGQLLVCEFSRPRPAPIRWGYGWYLRTVLPFLARRVSSNPEAYTYLQETIDAWPDQPSLARMIARSGWTDVVWKNMTFGVVALHHATRRPDPN
jgi:demethylmenaquinone methyltransferase/2-methoxy-6-polyprenyl-1,4-benzoquinol methylase